MWYEKTEKGKYKYTERYTDPLSNKQKYVSETLDRKNDKKAREILAFKINEKIELSLMYKGEKSTLKFVYEKYIDYLKNIKQVKSTTAYRNENAIGLMIDIISPKAVVDDLTVLYVRQQLVDSEKSNTTLNEYIKRFGAMIRWAYRNELITSQSLADKLEKFPDLSKKEKIKDKFLEVEEVKKLLDYMYSHNIRVALMIDFMIHTGMRYGEMAALTWNDIDFENQVISINKTYDSINKIVTSPKTLSSNRKIGSNNHIDKLLKNIKTLNNIISIENIVFQDKKGDYYHHANFNKHLKKAQQNLNMTKTITSHIFRHTHASLLFEKGLDIETISRRLGHSSPDGVTKDIYVHITNRKQQEDFEKIKQLKIL